VKEAIIALKKASELAQSHQEALLLLRG